MNRVSEAAHGVVAAAVIEIPFFLLIGTYSELVFSFFSSGFYLLFVTFSMKRVVDQTEFI